jgi:hypothetical protein
LSEEIESSKPDHTITSCMDNTTRDTLRLANYSYVLFLPSIVIWLYLSITRSSILISRLVDKNIPLPDYAYILGYALWLFVGVPCLYRIHKHATHKDYVFQTFHNFIPLCLFLVILSACWLTFFNMIRMPRTMLLEFHFFGPFIILLHSNILRRHTAIPQPESAVRTEFRKIYSGPFLNLAIMVIALQLTTLSIEFTFRKVSGLEPIGDWTTYGRRDDFVLRPYLMFAEPDKNHGGDLNSQGFPGDALPAIKSKHELRVAVLGGSAVWSGRTETSIAAHLEKCLRARYPFEDVKVINWGRQSYISMQELILLQRNVLPLNFDVVIIYDGYNDIWVPMYAEPEVGMPYLFTNLKHRSQIDFINVKYMAYYLASKSSIVHCAVKPRLDERPKPSFDLAKCIEEYRRNLFQMALLAKGYGTRIVFCVQPYIGRKRLTVSEKRLVSPVFLKDMEPAYSSLVEAAKEVAESTNSLYFDTVNLFLESREDIFYDRVHISREEGNPAVAKYIADSLHRFSLIDP